MQIPGLLIEYLINGSVALVWLLPILSVFGLSVQGWDATTVALFTPVLYVVGMVGIPSGGFC